MSLDTVIAGLSPASYISALSTAATDTGGLGLTWTTNTVTFGQPNKVPTESGTFSVKLGNLTTTPGALISNTSPQTWTALSLYSVIEYGASVGAQGGFIWCNKQSGLGGAYARLRVEGGTSLVWYPNTTDVTKKLSAAFTFVAGTVYEIGVRHTNSPRSATLYINGSAVATGDPGIDLSNGSGQHYWGEAFGQGSGLTGYYQRMAFWGTNLTDVNFTTDLHGAFAGTDTTPPTITSIAIPATGHTLVLTANEAITAGTGGNGGLTLSMSGGAVTATYASGSGTAAVTYDLSRSIYAGETGTVSYTQPGDGWEDAAGNDLATFATQPLTNNSTLLVAPTLLTVGTITSNSIDLSWTDNSTNETGFTLQYDVVDTFDSPVEVDIPTGDTETASTLDLAASTEYFFRVRAYNAGGASDWSNTANGTTSASASTGTGGSHLVLGRGASLVGGFVIGKSGITFGG